MKEDLTDITLLLDRSGSMRDIRYATIKGFNTFLEEQKKVEGEAVFSLIQFDDQFDSICLAKPIKGIPELNEESYIPRGLTRLYDAIGRAITETGERLKALEDKPGKVIFVILTDGLENDSREYTESKVIFNTINHQQTKYNWEFVFLGAKQDAIKTAASIGIKASSSMTFGKTDAGIENAFLSASKNMTNYRGITPTMASYAFDKDDREKQTEEIKNETT